MQIRLIAILIAISVNFSGCKSSKISSPSPQVISLRWGTLGVIQQNKINFYEIEHKKWQATEIPEFQIPKHESLLPVGLGHIGVINDGVVKFHSYVKQKGWKTQEYPDFQLPEYDQLISLSLGKIGIVKNNCITFYGVRDGSWQKMNQQIASFKLPPHEKVITLMLDPLGVSSIGIINEGELTLYHYHTDTKSWEQSDLEFKLPSYREIVSVGFGFIGIFSDKCLRFYELEVFFNGKVLQKKLKEIPDFIIANK